MLAASWSEPPSAGAILSCSRIPSKRLSHTRLSLLLFFHVFKSKRMSALLS